MLDLHAIKAQDISALNPSEWASFAEQLLAQINEQSRHIAAQARRIDSDAQAIKWRDAKIESITFQLARLKAWKFGAKTERMSAEQRSIFEEALAADEASLEAQLAALQAAAPAVDASAPDKKPRHQPKREALPAHLARVDSRVEPENTNCPSPECGKPMVRVGEDISERLDVVPAQFFVQRQIRGKWVCRCCQLMVQESAAPQVFDNALPTPALQAHTVISRFVDHLPYYRQEQINARSGVHTPRSTLAAWGGQTGAQLLPLYNAHRAFVLGSRVLHADETPIGLLDPGAGKTKRAYMWAYARGAFEDRPAVVYDFCEGRGGPSTRTSSSKAGGEHWSLMRTPGTTPPCPLRGAEPPIALLTREGKFDEMAQGQRQRRCCAGDPAHCLAVPDRGRRQRAQLRAAFAVAPRAKRSRCGKNCMSGCCWSVLGCPMAARLPRRSTTA